MYFVLAITVITLIIIDTIAGHPVEAMKANRIVRKYILERYGSLELMIEKTRYQNGMYMTTIRGKESLDTYFVVGVSGNKILIDDFDQRVKHKANTWLRLEHEFTMTINQLLKDKGLERVKLAVNTDEEAYKKYEHQLILDMPFDGTFAVEKTLRIITVLEECTTYSITELIKQVYESLKVHGHIFTEYECYIKYYEEQSEEQIGIQIQEDDLFFEVFNEKIAYHAVVKGVTASNIESSDLEQCLKEQRDNITCYINDTKYVLKMKNILGIKVKTIEKIES